MEIPDPVIVVEVLSPSTRRIDASKKLAGYFRLPSVAHYLIAGPIEPLILHHTRGPDDAILYAYRARGRDCARSAGVGVEVGGCVRGVSRRIGVEVVIHEHVDGRP